MRLVESYVVQQTDGTILCQQRHYTKEASANINFPVNYRTQDIQKESPLNKFQWIYLIRTPTFVTIHNCGGLINEGGSDFSANPLLIVCTPPPILQNFDNSYVSRRKKKYGNSYDQIENLSKEFGGIVSPVIILSLSKQLVEDVNKHLTKLAYNST